MITELREPSVETTAPPWRRVLPELFAVLAGAGLVWSAAALGDRLIRDVVRRFAAFLVGTVCLTLADGW